MADRFTDRRLFGRLGLPEWIDRHAILQTWHLETIHFILVVDGMPDRLQFRANLGL